MTVVHSRTADPQAICVEADILIAAIGKPEMVKGSWIKPGAAVIDVGTNPVPVRPFSYYPYHILACQAGLAGGFLVNIAEQVGSGVVSMMSGISNMHACQMLKQEIATVVSRTPARRAATG